MVIAITYGYIMNSYQVLSSKLLKLWKYVRTTIIEIVNLFSVISELPFEIALRSGLNIERNWRSCTYIICVWGVPCQEVPQSMLLVKQPVTAKCNGLASMYG